VVLPRCDQAADLRLHRRNDRPTTNFGAYSAHGRSAGGRSGLRQSAVNPGLTRSAGGFQSARLGCPIPSGSLVDAALLVVVAGSKVPEASRSDGAAAFDAVGAAWTIESEGATSRVGPCAGPAGLAGGSPMTSANSKHRWTHVGGCSALVPLRRSRRLYRSLLTWPDRRCSTRCRSPRASPACWRRAGCGLGHTVRHVP
jgi:hypothetical protein